MRKLLFGPGLLESTLNGSKCITIRKYREVAHKFHEGELVLGEFKEGVTFILRITRDTEIWTFEKIPEAHAISDGFSGREALYEGLKEYYPELEWGDLAGIIHFEAETDGNALLIVQAVEDWPEGGLSRLVADVGSDD